MVKNKIFTQVPLQDIERTKFNLSFTNNTTMYHGYLTPVGVIEALAHDTITADAKAFVRMSTPIAPIMGDIDLYVVAVNVPLRITWDNWTKFYGAQDDIIDISSIDNDLRIPKGFVPSFDFYDNGQITFDLLEETEFVNEQGDTVGEAAAKISIASYMTKISSEINYLINDLPLRAYFLTWNWLFRNEYLQQPVFVDTSDGTGRLDNYFSSSSGDGNTLSIGAHMINGLDASYFSPLLKVNKHGDRFTTSLPWPQKGDPVVLGLTDFAPVVTGPVTDVVNNYDLQWKLVGNPTPGAVLAENRLIGIYNGNTSTFKTNDDNILAGQHMTPANLYADLTQAGAVSINQLRIASAIQRMLERDAIYGTRYDEKLMAHFGVAPMSEILNQPQYLGGMKMAINIDTVLQTTGHSTGTTSSLGAPGAVSMSYNKGSLFTQSFSEPSYILLLAYTRQVRSYSFIDRLFLRDKKLDFYWPEFAHVGYSPVYTIEVGEVTDNFVETSFFNGVGYDDGSYYIQNPNLEEQDIFGYQEYANEYRYIPNKTSGLLNPSYPGALDYWTLTDGVQDFYLSANFIEEDRINIARALTTGHIGPDYIAQFRFEIYASRPMPAFGLPGETRKF